MLNRSSCLLACTTLCVEAGAQTVSPSNLPANYCAGSAVNSLTVNTSLVLSTDSDCTFVQAQSGGTDLCVISYQDITVASGATLTVAGSRVAALAALGAITIQGVVDATLAGPFSGPGNGQSPANAGAGGGGAGGYGSGGSGGQGNGSGGQGGSGGLVPVALVPLSGGSMGGSGAGGSGGGSALGGHGGGALQLVACGTLTVTSGAVLKAPGRGGAGGSPFGGGGGGGGSGGSLLVEGNATSIVGILAANGGGGGSGANNSGGFGQAGQDGTIDATQAPGGAGSPPAGSGGNGGTQVSPAPGGGGSYPLGGGGGGGGAAGRIRINACSALDVSGATISPPMTTGLSCPSDRIFANGFD